MPEFAIIGFLIIVIVSRIVSERALRSLTTEEKARLIDSLAGLRTYSMIPLVVLVLVTIELPKIVLGPRWLSMAVLFAATTCYVLIVDVITARKLAAANLPESYRKQLRLSRYIVYLGLALMYGTLAYDLSRT